MDLQRRWFIAGGAGFIGSMFVDRLLREPGVEKVTVLDNFSSGREWHVAAHAGDHRFTVVRSDIKDVAALTKAMADHDVVLHLASNPDIAKAMSDPTIDFVEGTLLTNNVVESARVNGVSTVLYASGSGVYGDIGDTEAAEDMGPLEPVSTYGSSKLAGEALIAAYCHMFGLRGRVFRFGNVVGPRQTHGVGFDFVRRLIDDPHHLRILGDGTQSKSYVDVHDVMEAVLLAGRSGDEPFRAFNVATGDYITVSEIADLAVAVVGLTVDQVAYEFTGGPRGWKGDVPVIRLNTSRIRALGWQNRLSSRAALTSSMEAMLPLARSGVLD